MKALGYALAILGGLMILSGISLGFTKYDFHKTDDISQFVGGLAISLFLFVGGIALINKAERKK